MQITRDLRRFIHAPTDRKLMAAEAVYALVIARLDTLRPATHYTAKLGAPAKDPSDASNVSDPPPEMKQIRLAAEIGQTVARVASWMPFRALCLQQVLAVRRMMRRRGLTGTIFLGLERERDETTGQREAHAWMRIGDRVVSGDRDLDRYVILGAYTA